MRKYIQQKPCLDETAYQPKFPSPRATIFRRVFNLMDVISMSRSARVCTSMPIRLSYVSALTFV